MFPTNRFQAQIIYFPGKAEQLSSLPPLKETSGWMPLVVHLPGSVSIRISAMFSGTKNALGDNASGNAATGPVFNCHSEENHSVVPMRQFRSATRAKWITPEGSNAGRPGLQCRHHAPSANSSVDRYRAPSSARIATMRFSAFSFRAAMTPAACSTAPELIPARTPSRQARNLAAA